MNTKNLVKAYATFNWNELARMETVYYVDGDKVFCSGERPFNNAFNPKGQQWHEVDAMPEGVEFIGNYQHP